MTSEILEYHKKSGSIIQKFGAELKSKAKKLLVGDEKFSVWFSLLKKFENHGPSM